VISRSMRRRLAVSRATVLSWRPTGARLFGLVRALVTTYVALGVSFYLLPGRQSTGPAAIVVLVLTVAVLNVVLRPLLLGLAALLGSFSLLLAGILAQAAVLAVAVSLAPDVHVSGFAVVLGATWLAAVVAAAVNWLLDSGTQDAYLATVLGRTVRVAQRHATSVREPGLVIVQLDGLGRGLLREALRAGATPTLSRWLRDGTHRGYRWHTGLPATTPAGQAVLLHGDVRTVPSFRWYEKKSGKLIVANRPADAAELQRRISTGNGLLAQGGVSVSNLFSGDAPTRILTMSDARLPTRTRGLATFATGPLGFIRTVVVFVGQVVEELYQGRRQRRRDVRPRVPRGRVFALLRAVTTAFLHDLNIAIVAEQMARGAPVIFVDFVDYDEVAHHAGPTRPESMRTLDTLDRVLGFLGDVAGEVNRDYEIAVVSDHGQSQGEPFEQLSGQRLDEVVAALVAEHAEPATHAGSPEQWSTANVLLTGAARSNRAIGALARRRADADDMTVALGDVPTEAAEVVVAASGSLAHLYLAAVSGWASVDTIADRYPALLPGLAAQAGIGAVVGCNAAGEPVVWTDEGWVDPDTSAAVAVYGPRAADDVRQLFTRDHTGDLVLLGRYDPDTDEVAAFEDLVGSHGGLGDDQTEAVLIVPTTWSSLCDPGVVLTGRQVHEALLDRLRVLGLRTDPVRDDAPSTVPS
jgi:uncharacterized membrane protein YvlD (DUF360 family)